MLDTYVLYKNLVAVGIPEAQAKVIQKAAFNYLETIDDVHDKEYEKLIDTLLKQASSRINRRNYQGQIATLRNF